MYLQADPSIARIGLSRDDYFVELLGTRRLPSTKIQPLDIKNTSARFLLRWLAQKTYVG
jgi:hypothetical protein